MADQPPGYCDGAVDVELPAGGDGDVIVVQCLVLGEVRRVGDDEVLFEIGETLDLHGGEGMQQHRGGGDAGRRGHGSCAFLYEGAVRCGGVQVAANAG